MHEKLAFTPEVDVPMINSAVDAFMAQLRVLFEDFQQAEELLADAHHIQLEVVMRDYLILRSGRLVESGRDMSRRISQVIEHAAVGSGPVISLIARLAILEDGIERIDARIQRAQIMR